VSGLRTRREDLADEALVVVRGGAMEMRSLRLDAVRAHRRFGEFAISVLAGPDEPAIDELARTTLRRHVVLTLVTAGAIRSAGLELRPTFRRPHYSVVLPNLDDGLHRLMTCQTVERDNPHYVPPEAQP